MREPPTIDQQHLQMLSLFHFLLAGLQVLIGCVPFIHLALGIAMVTGQMSTPGQPPPPPFLGWMLIGIACVVILLCWVFAICLAVAGRFIKRRRHRIFCIVIAGISCANAPLGTVLGVFTLIVLLRPSVKTLFDADEAPLHALPASTQHLGDSDA